MEVLLDQIHDRQWKSISLGAFGDSHSIWKNAREINGKEHEPQKKEMKAKKKLILNVCETKRGRLK